MYLVLSKFFSFFGPFFLTEFLTAVNRSNQKTGQTAIYTEPIFHLTVFALFYLKNKIKIVFLLFICFNYFLKNLKMNRRLGRGEKAPPAPGMLTALGSKKETGIGIPGILK